jgi:hypothetical protein
MSDKPDARAGHRGGGESAGRQGAPVVRWLDQEPSLPGTGRRATPPRLPWLPLIAIVLLLLTLGNSRLAPLLDDVGPVRPEFLGSWRTTAASYADRGFVISSDSLWLRLGPDVSIAYPVIGVREQRQGDAVLFTFLYGEDPSVLEMSLRMELDTTVYLAGLPSVRWAKEQP